MHYFGPNSKRTFDTPAAYAGHSHGYRQSVLVSASEGALHSYLTLNELQPGGEVDRHMHSFEEGAYLLEGEAIVALDDETLHLVPGDFFAAKAGTVHGWRAAGSSGAQWLQLAAPPPKPPGPVRDTFFARDRVVPNTGPLVSRGGFRALVGHFDASQIPPPGQPRAGVATLPGVFLQWMIDEGFGARHHRMLFIEYQPDVGIATHDHTFEETYFLLSGEIEAVMDGQTYLVKPGDVVWTSVGCVHTFKNRSNAPVRWIETFAPQPPAENVFRFVAEWEERGRALEQGAGK